MKSNWSIWGDYLIYKEDRYGRRFRIREKYDETRVVGWLAFDACSRIKNSFGSAKPLGSFKTRKEAVKCIENILRTVERSLDSLVPYLLKPIVDSLLGGEYKPLENWDGV